MEETNFAAEFQEIAERLKSVSPDLRRIDDKTIILFLRSFTSQITSEILEAHWSPTLEVIALAADDQANYIKYHLNRNTLRF